MSDEALNGNVQAIVDAYKAGLPSAKITNMQTKFASSIFGKELGSIAAVQTKYVLDVLDSIKNLIFGKSDPWAALSGIDKGNLISSLAIEALWKHNINDLAVIKQYVINQCSGTTTTKAIISGDPATFWSKNEWAVNRLIAEQKRYNDTLRLALNIAEITRSAVEAYEVTKTKAIAVSAIFKLKKGENITAEEKTAIKFYFEKKAATAQSMLLKIKTGNNG